MEYEEVGMTDLQFKSWLKRIIAELQEATDKETKQETDEKIERLLRDLKEDLQG